jgi:2-succinyl-5-enolpyruvyl-6-hydroxy-3-cyclohexene-1-carboxylate synthase
VKASYSLPEDGNKNLNEALMIIHEAWNKAHAYPCGPVHVNVPIAEPFYPEDAGDWPVYPAAEQASTPPAFLQAEIPEGLWLRLQKANRVLCVAGQQVMSAELKQLANALDIFPQITLVHDVISNGFDVEGASLSHDLFLSKLSREQKERLRPELLITTGKSLISKNLKLFLRDFPPLEHWHVDTREETPDPFGTLKATLYSKPEAFFRTLKERLKPLRSEYRKDWHIWDTGTRNALSDYAQEADWSEWMALYRVLEQVPPHGVLHLANSMAVRYVNFFAHALKGRNMEVHSNRGTSGIDGSNGTAVGFSLLDGRMQTLITGDLAFLYDPNAFWHAYPLTNLRIIVLNNGGGGIFRMIDGPARLPELETWFETRHDRKAKEIAGLYGWKYLEADNAEALDAALEDLYLPSEGPVLLEIFSNPAVNKSVFQVFKQRLRDYDF